MSKGIITHLFFFDKRLKKLQDIEKVRDRKLFIDPNIF